jgi:hypothetical protein
MKLKNYFNDTRGLGVLSTADDEGKVNIAVYARPQIMEDGTVAFLMRERLTHHNLQKNRFAAYLFKKEENGYSGIRLHLEKIGEETDVELIKKMTRRSLTPEEDIAKGPKFLVYFKVNKILNLIGGVSPEIELN